MVTSVRHSLDLLLSLLRLLWVVFTVRAASFVSTNLEGGRLFYLGNKPSTIPISLFPLAVCVSLTHSQALQFSSFSSTLFSWCFYARRSALFIDARVLALCQLSTRGSQSTLQALGVVKRFLHVPCHSEKKTPVAIAREALKECRLHPIPPRKVGR